MQEYKLVNSNKYNAKTITMEKNGKYIILTKENSRIEYKFDLSAKTYEDSLTKITHQKGKEDVEEPVYPGDVTTWFANCNLVTTDRKFALLFICAASIAHRYRAIPRFINELSHYQVQRIEQWLSRGIEFKKLNNCLEKLQNNGDLLYVRKFVDNTYYDPSDFNKEQLKFLKNISDKEKGIDSNTIRHIKYHWNPAQNKMNEKLDKVLQNPIYEEAFEVTSFSYSGDKEVSNYFDDDSSNYRSNTRAQVLEVMSNWGLDPEAFCNYLLKLKYEAVEIDDLMRNYDDYLEREYEMRGEKRSKMNKYPLNWMSYYHKHYFNYQQMKALRRKLFQMGNIELYDLFTKRQKNYEFKDKKYLIRLPRTVEDIAIEATQQHHCLYNSYLDKIIDGTTTVLFMREVEDPNTSVLTVEIKHNAINQARGYDNDDPTDEQRKWLLKWAKRIKIQQEIRQNYR